MFIGRRPGPRPFVDLGSLDLPAEGIRRDAELLPDPRAQPMPATGVVTRIKHKTHCTWESADQPDI